MLRQNTPYEVRRAILDSETPLHKLISDEDSARILGGAGDEHLAKAFEYFAGKKNEETVYLRIVSECPSGELFPRKTTMEDTLRVEEKVLGLARKLNIVANTDHQQVAFFPMVLDVDSRRFFEHQGNGARIGYAFDSLTGEIYFALDGEIDATIAERFLVQAGYEVQRVKGIPSSSKSLNSILRNGSDSSNGSYKLSKEELAERLAIERSHNEID